LADERYGPARELTSDRDDVLSTPLLPGLELTLRAVFDDTN